MKILTRATFPLYSHHESTEDDGGVIILIIQGRWKGGGGRVPPSFSNIEKGTEAETDNLLVVAITKRTYSSLAY